MKNLSLTGVSMIVAFAIWIARWQGLDLDEGQVTELVTAVAQVVSILAVFVGQYKRKDLQGGIVRV